MAFAHISQKPNFGYVLIAVLTKEALYAEFQMSKDSHLDHCFTEDGAPITTEHH